MALIDVVMPTYNAAAYIGEALDSIFSQGDYAFRVIVVNDGSTDNTEQVLQPWMDRIAYFSKPNEGVVKTRNYALDRLEGDFVAFLDADDVWLPGKIEKQLAILNSNAEIGGVYGNANLIDSEGKADGRSYIKQEIREELVPDLYAYLFLKDPIPTSNLILRRAVLEQAGRFDPALPGTEDYDMWLRVARLTLLHYIDEPLSLYRVHGSNISRNLLVRHRDNLIILKRHLQRSPEIRARLGRRLSARLAREHYAYAYWLYKAGQPLGAAAQVLSFMRYKLFR